MQKLQLRANNKKHKRNTNVFLKLFEAVRVLHTYSFRRIPYRVFKLCHKSLDFFPSGASCQTFETEKNLYFLNVIFAVV